MSVGYFVGIGLDFQKTILTELSEDARALLSEIISIRGYSSNAMSIKASNDDPGFFGVIKELQQNSIMAHVKGDSYFLNPDAIVVAQKYYKSAKEKWNDITGNSLTAE
jgi:hypothetical protein